MILVTTGTNAPPFNRLLHEVDRLRLDEHVVVQHGPSTVRPVGAECVDYLSFDRFVELVDEARVVVTHAGVGSILVTLLHGKRPVVIPRRAAFGEHVDDHQVELSRRLAGIDVVTLVESGTELEHALRSNGSAPLRALDDRSGRLVAELRGYLHSVVGDH